jgi:hypothetical protein
MAGTLGVGWFATSAGMYNIIRGMPFALPTRDGRKTACFLTQEVGS